MIRSGLELLSPTVWRLKEGLKRRMIGCCRKPGGEDTGLNWSGSSREGESRWFQEFCRQQGQQGPVAGWM